MGNTHCVRFFGYELCQLQYPQTLATSHKILSIANTVIGTVQVCDLGQVRHGVATRDKISVQYQYNIRYVMKTRDVG